MKPNTPERLTRWQINTKLSIDHPVQEDLAWAADLIADHITDLERYKQALTRANGFLIMHDLEPVKLEPRETRTDFAPCSQSDTDSKPRRGTNEQ